MIKLSTYPVSAYSLVKLVYLVPYHTPDSHRKTNNSHCQMTLKPGS